MTETEKSILTALNDLDTAVKNLRTANPKPDLAPILRQLDDLTGHLPKDTSPDLLHYLHRKSYEKARLLLLGRDAENARGGCSRD
jgi:hypothetical protein